MCGGGCLFVCSPCYVLYVYGRLLDYKLFDFASFSRIGLMGTPGNLGGL